MKNRVHVRRKKAKRLNLKQLALTFKSGYLSVIVWGGFSALGRTSLVGTYGSFTRDAYRMRIHDLILQFMYEPLFGPGSFVLQEDNCGPHRAKRIASY